MRYLGFSLLLKSFFLICLMTLMPAQLVKAQVLINPQYCNTPLVGPGRVVDNIPGNLANILSGSPTTLNNLIDGDLSNYATFTTSASLGNIPLVSIKDVSNYYPAGVRAGFVVRTDGALLNLSLLTGGFVIKTYRNNILRETINLGNSATLKVELVGTSDRRQRISFVTQSDFDEIEISQTSTLSLITSIRVYHAFVEPQAGCDYNCITPITTKNYPSASATAGTTGGCVLCGTSNIPNLTDTTLTNYATTTVFLGVAGSAYVSVKPGAVIPAGSDAGFVLATSSGVLDATLLNNTTIEIWRSGSRVGSQTFGSLANIAILSNNLQALSFTTQVEFDEIRLVEPSLLSLDVTYRVYYAFIRKDADRDSYPDCVDKCPTGPDYLDADGDGIPDACDTSCNLNLGMDKYLCVPETSYDFSTLGLTGALTWSILSSSTPGASVSTTGVVTNMINPGTYYIRVSNTAGCADTIAITKRDPKNVLFCNVPITGSGVEVFDPSGGGCLLCINTGTSGNPNNVIDGDLSNFVVTSSLVSVGNSTPVIGVRNKEKVYPVGTRTGFAVKNIGGLLSASVLSNVYIRTYLAGQPRETFTASQLLLSAEVLSGDKNLQKISAVTTQSFDAVALYVNGIASVLTGLRVYYAFEESSTACSNLIVDDCTQMITADNSFKAQFEMTRTGYFGLACLNCQITNLGNIIDNNSSNYATITQTVGVGAISSVSIKTPQTITPKYQTGFIISSPVSLLDATVLGGITINTYNNGTPVDSYTASAALINLQVIDAASGKIMIRFTPTANFNEIRLSIAATVSALQTINVYGAFVRADSDGDGVPDCMDKCCGSNDFVVDPDGYGIPAACNISSTNDAACSLCPITVSIINRNAFPGYNFALYEGITKIRSFNPDTLIFTPKKAGLIRYTIQISNDNVNFYPVKDIVLNIHPSSVKWTPASSTNTNWDNPANWTLTGETTGQAGSPYWCTDVLIPEGASTYPVLISGDQCRDIYFEANSAVGKIPYLKYRFAYVDFNPPRNAWVMSTAPLKYMYSADYGADISWTNAISPKVFMRFFDVDYSRSEKMNPDGVKGTSSGNFSRAFAQLSETLTASEGFVIWVNGTPYPETNFPTGRAYKFPRRDANGDDVLYRMHTEDGNWSGPAYYMTNRGNDIKNAPAWTSQSVPDKSNRYRFIFENLTNNGSEFTRTVRKGITEIIGNPFMSYVDFNQFYNDNSTVIYNYYRTWDGTQFHSYMYGPGTETWSGLGGISSTGDSPASQYIAPMGSFFVETKGDAPSDLLKFTTVASDIKRTSPLRNSESSDFEILYLNIEKDSLKSYALLALLPGASNDVIIGEDVIKLFSPFEDVAEIYTVCDNEGMEINAISNLSVNHLIPIGIKTSEVGSMKLGIKGSENISSYNKIKLIDKLEKKEYDLDSDFSLSFEKDSTENLEGRFYISFDDKSFTGILDPNNTENVISLAYDGQNVSINSSSEKINAIELYDYSGIMQIKLMNVDSYNLRFPFRGVSGAYILKVKTDNSTENFKIMMK